MNRLGNLSDLPSNPTGFMVTLIMLGIVTLMFTFGICEYRGILSSIDAAHAGGLERGCPIINLFSVMSLYRAHAEGAGSFALGASRSPVEDSAHALRLTRAAQ